MGVIHDPRDEGPWDDELLVGSLMGDGHVEPVTDQTFLYREGHCWGQLAYAAMKYQLLRPRSSAVTLKRPSKGLADYSVHTTTVASKSLRPYRDLFYVAPVPGKILPQKNTLRHEVFSRLTPRAVAFWVMDDGKKYGSARGCFELTVGRQPFHDIGSVEGLASLLSDVLGFSMKPHVSGRSISFSNGRESMSRVMGVIGPHIHPLFAYKLGVGEDEIGSALRSECWFQKWEGIKTALQHPLIAEVPYEQYRSSTDPVFRERYIRALFVRTRARGFPYPALSGDGRAEAWQAVKDDEVRESSGVLTCYPRVNAFPASFMPHRYRCSQRGRTSPYEAYLSNRLLRRTLEAQLRDGPAIEDTNIRNALSVYVGLGVGQFNTGVARWLVESLCPQGGAVLDPCAGWGNRLCGAAAAGRGYHGIEPCGETFKGLVSISAWLKAAGVAQRISVVQGVAEDPSAYGVAPYDFAITSPPYFDTERYSDEGTQSSVRYPEYGLWLSGFLGPMVACVHAALKPGAAFALNIADVKGRPLESDALSVALSCGFSLERTYRLGAYRRPGMPSARSEPVLVLRKGA